VGILACRAPQLSAVFGVSLESEREVADSRDVAAALKAVVFPVLRDAGFTRFRSRAAWRVGQNAVEGAREAWQRMLGNPYYQRILELRQEAERRLALIDPVCDDHT
jgi:hypothetical protein